MLLLHIAAERGVDAALEASDAINEANLDAVIALEHDDSEWADRINGYDQPDSIQRNDAGEFVGLM